MGLRESRMGATSAQVWLLISYPRSTAVFITDIVVKQTGQAGCSLTVDIQTSFHSFLLLLVHLKLESMWTQGLEVAPIQSPNCADWHSMHVRVRISGCPPPGFHPLVRNVLLLLVTKSCEVLLGQ